MHFVIRKSVDNKRYWVELLESENDFPSLAFFMSTTKSKKECLEWIEKIKSVKKTTKVLDETAKNTKSSI